MIPAEGLSVIDNPAQVEHLIAKLRAALPLSAAVRVRKPDFDRAVKACTSEACAL